MTSRLVGSPDTIAREAVALFDQTELDGLMVVFPDYLKSMPVFSEHIAPRIRERFRAIEGDANAA
jgi:pyrimidine oxygenase